MSQGSKGNNEYKKKGRKEGKKRVKLFIKTYKNMI